MSLLLNRAKVSTATTGTGTVNLGSAVVPFQSWAAALAVTTRVYDYLIEDGNDWEIGLGKYTSGAPDTLTRTLIASSTGSLLNLSGSATVACVANADAYVPVSKYTKPLAADFPTSRSAGGSPSIVNSANTDAIEFTLTRGASRQYSIFLKDVGIAAPWTVETAIYCGYTVDDPFWWFGLGIGDTTNNQQAWVGFMSNNTGILGPIMAASYSTSLTIAEVAMSGGGGGTFSGGPFPNTARLFRMSYDGTTLNAWFSPDGFGLSWYKIGSIAGATVFSVGPTKCGLFGGYTASSGTLKGYCPHFRVLPYLT